MPSGAQSSLGQSTENIPTYVGLPLTLQFINFNVKYSFFSYSKVRLLDTIMDKIITYLLRCHHMKSWNFNIC